MSMILFYCQKIKCQFLKNIFLIMIKFLHRSYKTFWIQLLPTLTLYQNQKLIWNLWNMNLMYCLPINN
ncbi:hypothetical protein CVS40_10293 [Lucilia cuprina]|nr:hypothetical protein CVS40_10293 [Lucilia cuprina]